MTVAGLHLRLARPGDLSAVDALFAHSYARLIRADYPPSVLVTAVPRLARAQPALLASGRYWLAETEGDPRRRRLEPARRGRRRDPPSRDPRLPCAAGHRLGAA